jgi:quinohemoprotein amine dehydrogenase beta subunit
MSKQNQSHPRVRRVGLLLVSLIFAVGLPATGLAKEMLLVGTKSNHLVLADAATRTVVSSHQIPGGGSVFGIVTSPDDRIAYAMTKNMSAISGIDLDSGEQVFRADFDEEGVRVRGFSGLEISRDGKELFALQLPTKMLKAEYQVQDPRIAVYSTADGLNAKPVRYLPVPRRTALLLMSTDNSRLYAVSWDIYVLDPKTGDVLEVKKTSNWERANYAPPDIFGVWGQFSQAETFVNPYFTLRTDMSMDDPDAWKTGMLTLDLETGELVMDDFESTSAIIFSGVVNPVRRNEVYGVYNNLSKVDLDTDKLVKRVDIPHTYYVINVAGDGNELYIAGTQDDIGIYSTETLERVGEIRMPDGADMGASWIRVIQR